MRCTDPPRVTTGRRQASHIPHAAYVTSRPRRTRQHARCFRRRRAIHILLERGRSAGTRSGDGAWLQPFFHVHSTAPHLPGKVTPALAFCLFERASRWARCTHATCRERFARRVIRRRARASVGKRWVRGFVGDVCGQGLR